MARILVTGATGFIGQHVVKQLAGRGHQLSCFVRDRTKAKSIESCCDDMFIGDVTNVTDVARAVGKQDVVIHLAGVTKSPKTKLMQRVNVEGSHNIARTCAAKLSPPVLLHVSSLAAAGPSSIDNPRTEQQAETPVSNYGKSKLEGEQAVQEFANQVPISILRPGIVMGEGDRDVFELFGSVSRLGFVLNPGWRDNRFSFLHVWDLVSALEVVLEKGERVDGDTPGSGRYFAGDPKFLTFAEIGNMIGKVLSKKRVVSVYSPNWLIWSFAAICELGSAVARRPFILNLDKAREATAGSWHCDVQKLVDIGFQPEPMMRRLAQTADWYRNEGWIKSKPAQPVGSWASSSQDRVSSSREQSA